MKEDRKQLDIVNRWLYCVIRSTFHFAGALPSAVRNTWAVRLGNLFYALDRKHRRVAIKNLTIAFGKEKSAAEIQAIARQTFHNLGRLFFEIGWTMQMPRAVFDRHFTLRGTAHYQAARETGRGVFILTAHFGNWELLPIAAHMAGMQAAMVYRPIDLPALDLMIKENRGRFGGLPIKNRKGATRDIFRALRQGYSVGLLVDQNEGKRRGIFVEFFGHTACTNPGLAKLVLKTDALVVPFFLIRQAHGFTAEFGAPLHPVRTGDDAHDLAVNTQMYNDVIESCIRRHPDQWFWVHNRWKTRPLAGRRRANGRRRGKR